MTLRPGTLFRFISGFGVIGALIFVSEIGSDLVRGRVEGNARTSAVIAIGVAMALGWYAIRHLMLRAEVDSNGVSYVNRFSTGTVPFGAIVDVRVKGWVFRDVRIATASREIRLAASVHLPLPIRWLNDSRSIPRFVALVREGLN